MNIYFDCDTRKTTLFVFDIDSIEFKKFCSDKGSTLTITARKNGTNYEARIHEKDSEVIEEKCMGYFENVYDNMEKINPTETIRCDELSIY